ncbi:hypothetical protein DBV15_01502 [Temnothorax longispinosus]|uniref:C2H2-type domain-containing protein n=1 Tax=Temnothorax longispinosus TaxID=300112 RepID=A0A4S2KTV8_9HYME|nr:hypothetical protein DBV15_01502 [Temnothorax longispinosus]
MSMYTPYAQSDSLQDRHASLHAHTHTPGETDEREETMIWGPDLELKNWRISKIFERQSNSDERRRCSLCGKVVTNVRNHYYVHFPGKYACPLCPAVYTRSDTLLTHTPVDLASRIARESSSSLRPPSLLHPPPVPSREAISSSPELAHLPLDKQDRANWCLLKSGEDSMDIRNPQGLKGTKIEELIDATSLSEIMKDLDFNVGQYLGS